MGVKYNGLRFQRSSNIIEKTRWYVRVRWMFLLAIAVPGIASNALGEGLSEQVRRDVLLAIVALASNALFFIATRPNKSNHYFKKLTISVLVIDIITITVLIFTKGGIESRSPILYTIPILIASAIFGQKAVYYVSLSAVALYNLLIVSDYAGLIHTIGAVNPDLRSNGTYVLNTISFFTSVLLIIAILADFITRLLGEQQRLTEQKHTQLEEAQRIARIGSWSWDVSTDKIEWSKQLYVLFGIKRQQFDGSFDGYLSFVHPDDREMVRETVGDALKTGESFRFDHRIGRGKDVVWLHSEGNVILEAGKPSRMFGTAQDVTALKQADEHLLEKNQELETINQLMVGREIKMIELKQEIQQLEQRLKSGGGAS